MIKKILYRICFLLYADINTRTCDYDTVLILAARARSIWETSRNRVTVVSVLFHIFSNTKQDSKPEIIDYLLHKIYAGEVKAINERDDEHRTAVRIQICRLCK